MSHHPSRIHLAKTGSLAAMARARVANEHVRPAGALWRKKHPTPPPMGAQETGVRGRAARIHVVADRQTAALEESAPQIQASAQASNEQVRCATNWQLIHVCVYTTTTFCSSANSPVMMKRRPSSNHSCWRPESGFWRMRNASIAENRSLIILSARAALGSIRKRSRRSS